MGGKPVAFVVQWLETGVLRVDESDRSLKDAELLNDLCRDQARHAEIIDELIHTEEGRAMLSYQVGRSNLIDLV